MIQTNLPQSFQRVQIERRMEESEQYKRLSEDSVKGLTDKDKAQFERLRHKLVFNNKR